MSGKKSLVATEYQQPLETIVERIEQSRQETLRTVNRALVELYWFIGQVITERQERAGWGDAVVEQLSRDLRMRFPDMQGLSAQNLWRMRQFYLVYRDEPPAYPRPHRVGDGAGVLPAHDHPGALVQAGVGTPTSQQVLRALRAGRARLGQPGASTVDHFVGKEISGWKRPISFRK